MTMTPKQASDLKPFDKQGVMLGLWRQCLRILPGRFECYDDVPGDDLQNQDQPEVFCEYLYNTYIVIL